MNGSHKIQSLLDAVEIFEKRAQDAAAEKRSYDELMLVNKYANYLYNQIARSQYNDQIKFKIRRISEMFGKLATKAYKSGISKEEADGAKNEGITLLNALRTLIHENTYKPFDDLIKAVQGWTPILLPAGGKRPEGTTATVNVPASVAQPLATQTTIAPIAPGGIAGF